MRLIIKYNNMMNFEKLNLQPVQESPETDKFKEQLSDDYQEIRAEALAIIDEKLVLMKEKLSANAPEVAAYEAAKEKLNNDQFILSAAKINNWEKLRDQAEDVAEADKRLAQGLARSALSQS